MVLFILPLTANNYLQHPCNNFYAKRVMYKTNS